MILLLIGCPSPEPEDSTTPDAGPAVKPSIVEITRLGCEPQQSGSDTWSFEMTTDDPQGADTVDEGTYDVVNAAGAVLYDSIVVCDDAGICYGSFRQALTGIGCDMDGEISFRFQVTDENGNRSETVTYDTGG